MSFFIAAALLLIPVTAHAFISFLKKVSANEKPSLENSQNILVLNPYSPHASAHGGGTITVEEDSLLVPHVGPVGTPLHTAKPNKDAIHTYIVRQGDTLGSIANLFDVTTGTIRSFNDISSGSTLRTGQELLILPVDGIEHTVSKGDTVEKLATKYKADELDIILFNALEGEELVLNTKLIIPYAEAHHEAHSVPTPKTPTPSIAATKTTHKGGSDYFIRAWGGVRSQNYHGAFRARDYGMPIGTSIGASAAGVVIAAKQGGWNGGYGNMVILKHNNGAQTLYAHLNQVLVEVGQQVAQREEIGKSGNTGRSTGPHLHFEIRGWGDIPF